MTHYALNPYLGLGGLHGGYRNAPQTTYGNPTFGAYPGDAGVQAQAAANYQSQLLAQQAALGSLQNAYAQQAALVQLAYAHQRASLREPRIEHAGVKVGEITAWRCWLIDLSAGYLRSVFTGSRWEYDKPMTGDVRGAGVHAWKDKDVACGYIHGMTPHAIGRVKLWGEVVEHEKGYRAENAKIVSIDMVRIKTLSGFFWKRGSNKVLKNLRTNYGVN